MYVTPVIYTYFDELKIRYSRGHEVDRGPKTEDRRVLEPGVATASARAAHRPD